MVHAADLHSRIRQVATVTGILVVAIVAGYGLKNNSQLLRTSAIGSQETATIAQPSPANANSSHVTNQFRLQHPSNWTPQESIAAHTKTTTIGEVVITSYGRSIDIPEFAIAEQLSIDVQDLFTWPGQLGATTGQYWAAGSRLNDTVAPQGQRLYITKNPAGTVSLLIPAPPYGQGVTSLLDSFQLR